MDSGRSRDDPLEIPENWRRVVEQSLEKIRSRTPRKDREGRKTLDEVFDHSTLLVLYRLISRGFLKTLDYPISTGKEGNVFHATLEDGREAAVKIYRTSTATFRNLLPYIEGDPRLGRVGRNRRDLVFAWAKKEFKNLYEMTENRVRVPTPFAHDSNVLLMEFIGKEGTPAFTMKEAPFEDPGKAYEEVVESYRRMYHGAHLVHGDLSEFNILNFGEVPVIIDVAQSVLRSHPKAEELLSRDIRNVARAFSRAGLDLSEEDVRRQIEEGNGS